MSPSKPSLSEGTRRHVRAFAEALFSRDVDEAGSPVAPPEARMAWFITDIDDFVAHLNLRARWLFHLCIYAVSLLAPLVAGRFGTLAGLPLPARIAALEAFEQTPAALALFAARAIVSLVYYEHPDAAKEIHWDRQSLQSAAIASRASVAAVAGRDEAIPPLHRNEFDGASPPSSSSAPMGLRTIQSGFAAQARLEVKS